MTHILEITAVDDQMDADTVAGCFYPCEPPPSSHHTCTHTGTHTHPPTTLATFELTIQINGVNAKREVAQALR